MSITYLTHTRCNRLFGVIPSVAVTALCLIFTAKIIKRLDMTLLDKVG